MIGLCTSLEKAHLAIDAGFDYVELSASEIAQRTPWTTEPYKGLPIEAVNLFFPGGISLWDRTNFNANQYISDLKPRLCELGVKIAVMGSGGQRRCPDDIQFPYRSDAIIDSWHGAQNAEEIFRVYPIWFNSMPGEGITVAPESLNRTETNVGNDLGSFARTLKAGGVEYTADFYHVLREWDFDGREGGLSAPSQAFWEDQLPFAPVHVHLAQLEGRHAPEPNDPMLLPAFARLRELGYAGRYSLECNDLEPDQYAQAIANLQTYI